MKIVVLLIQLRNVMNLLSFNFYSSKFYYKLVVVMEKKTSKWIIEIVKAILYSVLGLLGGNALL